MNTLQNYQYYFVLELVREKITWGFLRYGTKYNVSYDHYPSGNTKNTKIFFHFWIINQFQRESEKLQRMMLNAPPPPIYINFWVFIMFQFKAIQIYIVWKRAKNTKGKRRNVKPCRKALCELWLFNNDWHVLQLILIPVIGTDVSVRGIIDVRGSWGVCNSRYMQYKLVVLQSSNKLTIYNNEFSYIQKKLFYCLKSFFSCN